MEREFDVVIIAGGFGDETTVAWSGATTYWASDEVDRARDNPAFSKLVVSGAGDGGLIDAIRLIQKKFEKGLLALRLATTLNGMSLAKQMVELERAARQNEANEHEILRDGYLRLIELFRADQKELLDAPALCNIGKLRLFGRDTTAYSTRTAPIHKLIIAHAEKNGAIQYVQGETDDSSQDIQVVDIATGHKTPLITDFYVKRHGAEPAVKSLIEGFSDDNLIALRQKQLLIADRIDLGDYSTNDFCQHLRQFPAKHFGGPDYARLRHELASNYLFQSYGETRLELGTMGSGKPVFEVERSDDKPLLQNAHGFTDSELFGIPFRTRLPESGRRTSGRQPMPFDEGKFQPGVPISGNEAKTDACTLGLIVSDRRSKNIVGLTAAHVSGADTGIRSFATGLLVGQLVRPTEIASNETSIVSEIATFVIGTDVVWHAEPILGPLPKHFVLPIDCFDRTVLKVSTRSGLTEGRISRIFGTIWLPDPTTNIPRRYVDTIEVVSTVSGSGTFSAAGDSGALVLTTEGGVVGIVVGTVADRTIVAPLFALAKVNDFMILTSGEDAIAHRNSIPDEYLELIEQIKSDPDDWSGRVNAMRSAIAERAFSLVEAGATEYLYSVENATAAELLSVIGIERIADGMARLEFQSDDLRYSSFDRWLFQAWFERTRALEISLDSRSIRAKRERAKWISVDARAQIQRRMGSAPTIPFGGTSRVDILLGVQTVADVEDVE